MAECEFMMVCSVFFNNKPDNSIIIYRMKYCKTKVTNCARYQVIRSKGKKHVPLDLHPHDRSRAKKIISE